jgi:hypothetical protein
MHDDIFVAHVRVADILVFVLLLTQMRMSIG